MASWRKTTHLCTACVSVRSDHEVRSGNWFRPMQFMRSKGGARSTIFLATCLTAATLHDCEICCAADRCRGARATDCASASDLAFAADIKTSSGFHDLPCLACLYRKGICMPRA